MENFSEFDRPGTAPQKDAGSIISHAWDNYKGIIGYGILSFIITFIVSSLISSIFPGSPLSLDSMKEIMESAKSGDSSAIKDIIESNSDRSFGDSALSMVASILSSALLYPLSAGLIYINHKFNTKQNISLNDMFIGYQQNTGNLMIYGVVISVLASIGMIFCLVPGIYVYIAGFIGLPIMFFENRQAMDGISKSFKITNDNLGLVVGTAILSFLIAIAGALLCGIGVILTFPFIHSASYSLYCAIFGTPYEIKN